MDHEQWRSVNQAWERRRIRQPANFGSYTAYLKSVESGLLQQEPTDYTLLGLPQLQHEIQTATFSPMPEWRPSGKATCNRDIEWADDE